MLKSVRLFQGIDCRVIVGKESTFPRELGNFMSSYSSQSVISEQSSIADLLTALKRRKGRVLMISSLIMLISVALAFGLPPVYRSAATILIEEQDIPADLVRSTITSFADQRIQVISQKVMTRANLNTIIDKFDLYHDERRTMTPEQVLDEMRADITMEMVSADVIDPRSGRPTQATIAFSLSYDNEHPQAAQRVTNELVSLYLTENIRNRRRKVEEASDFLSDDANKLHRQLTDLESRLATFKEKNIGRLPELMNLNMQMLDRSERDLQNIDTQLSLQEERAIYLQGQLAQLDPTMVASANSLESVVDPGARLRILELRLLGKQASYAEDHPDVIKLKNEINGIRKELGIAVRPASTSSDELQRLQTDLAIARERYSDQHPDVKRLRKQIARLGESGAHLELGNEDLALPATNPAYVNLQSQLETARLKIKALIEQRKQVRAKMVDYETRLVHTPEVEREYQDLTRERENVLRSYQEAREKQMQAKIAQELENERKGERFSMVEPPLLPEVPIKPNRIALLFLGLVLSLGGGFGYGIIAEGLDSTVRGRKMLEKISGQSVLVSIPYLSTADELRAEKAGKLWLFAVAVLLLAVILALIHNYWKPLDVIWFVLMRRLGLG